MVVSGADVWPLPLSSLRSVSSPVISKSVVNRISVFPSEFSTAGFCMLKNLCLDNICCHHITTIEGLSKVTARA